MTNVKGNGYILQLIADLSRDPALCDRLANDPTAVIRDYGISPAGQAILRGRNTDQLAGEIAREAREIIARLRENPPIAPYPWPTNEPTVDSISPPGGVVDTRIPVTVYGTLFDSKATLSFKMPGVTVNATDVSVTTNPSGRSTMTAQAAFTTPGVYDVVVTNPGGTFATLPAGFTVTSKATR